jgi:HK97 family phage major capsid protein
MPTSDDTDNTGALVGENADVGTITDLSLGSKALHAYMFTSKPLRVSIQFLQDASITNVEGWIADRLAERISRGLAPYFITGTGNNQPEGLASAGTLGATGASETLVTWDDFVELEHSVDAAYRRQAEYLLGDGILKAAKKLKDGEGRPLWVPGVAIKAPDTINGYPFQVDQEIPTPAADAITMYFGDFSKFYIRDVLGMQMLRLTERYAEYLQVAFLLFSRHDSVLLDAGTHPVKYFQQAS